jgi:hypothetical protein
MAIASDELRKRLRKFLADPKSDQEFSVWFAYELRDAHKAADPALESLLHAIQRAFSFAADGTYSPAELRSALSSLSRDSVAVNQLIFVHTSILPASVNQLVIEERSFPFPESSAYLEGR